MPKHVLSSLLPFFKVKGQGKGQISFAQRLILGARLCRVQQSAKKSHYQSKVFVRVSNNGTEFFRLESCPILLIELATCLLILMSHHPNST